jgi:hypothetical protein
MIIPNATVPTATHYTFHSNANARAITCRMAMISMRLRGVATNLYYAFHDKYNARVITGHVGTRVNYLTCQMANESGLTRSLGRVTSAVYRARQTPG